MIIGIGFVSLSIYNMPILPRNTNTSWNKISIPFLVQTKFPTYNRIRRHLPTNSTLTTNNRLKYMPDLPRLHLKLNTTITPKFVT